MGGKSTKNTETDVKVKDYTFPDGLLYARAELVGERKHGRYWAWNGQGKLQKRDATTAMINCTDSMRSGTQMATNTPENTTSLAIDTAHLKYGTQTA